MRLKEKILYILYIIRKILKNPTYYLAYLPLFIKAKGRKIQPGTNYPSYIQRVSKVWGEEDLASKLQDMVWLSSGPIQSYVNRLVSTNSQMDWLYYTKQKYFPEEKDKGLILGCGNGWLERYAHMLGFCSQYDACDIALEAIQRAESTAIKEGISNIHYFIQDLNFPKLKKESYDVVFAVFILHHIFKLESLLAEVKRSLKPGGLFIVFEYVGPSQFQWTEKQLRIINDLLAILPDRYKTDMTDGKSIRNKAFKHSVDMMNVLDPSEAIRSNDILPLIYNYFNVIERKDVGGTILNLLFYSIVGNFNPSEEDDLAFLQFMIYLEELLIKGKCLHSDFTFLVASSPPSR